MMDNLSVVSNVSSVAASPVTHDALIETAKTWIAYAGVLVVAVVTAWAGVRKALKDLRGDGAVPAPANTGGPAAGPDVQRIVGGTIMETTTLLMWSESNRDAVEAMVALKAAICTLVDRIESAVDRFDVIAELKGEAVELRHQIERLRDKMP